MRGEARQERGEGGQVGREEREACVRARRREARKGGSATTALRSSCSCTQRESSPLCCSSQAISNLLCRPADSFTPVPLPAGSSIKESILW